MSPDSHTIQPTLAADFCAPEQHMFVSQCEKIAVSPHSVLITGESGTGKSRLARALHAASSRAAAPFVEISCATFSSELLESELFGYRKGAFSGAVRDKPGLCEQADGGTLFLDEIGEMAIALQPKLLLFLQQKHFYPVGSVSSVSVDVRIISATNQDLQARVQERGFRSDLLYRLNTFELALPPLRARRAEIPVLAYAFLKHARQEASLPDDVEFSPAALDLLLNYDWPGNIRELRNYMIRLATLTDVNVCVQPDHLPFVQEKAQSQGEQQALNLVGKTLQEIEVEALRQTLAATGGRRSETARMLGVSEKTVYNLIRRHQLE